MKIALIWSTPNENGLTASAKNSVAAGLAAQGCEVNEVWLNKLSLEHCRACGNGFGLCRTQGTCVIDDDFRSAYDTLIAADGLVFVTAVYWHDMTEQLKTFVDRLRRCENSHDDHRLGQKHVMLVACAGGSGNGAIECLDSMEDCMRHMGLRTCERLPVIRFNQAYMLPALEQAGAAFARLLAE